MDWPEQPMRARLLRFLNRLKSRKPARDASVVSSAPARARIEPGTATGPADPRTLTLASPPDASGTAPAFWGNFELRARIGSGSYGEVWRAWDAQLQREVALKLLKPRSSEDAMYEAMLREARALARIRHVNVAPVYGVDGHDGRIGFWSEYIRGSTLQALVLTHGPFNAREAGLIGIDICRAVSAVHGAGLLHRDIKASNVMRESGGRIVLLDFGLSQESGKGPGAGTPVYMAPELLRGMPSTQASDIYAIGVLLYYLVTGNVPVPGESLTEVCEMHERGARRSLYDDRPDLPDEFARIVEKATDPDAAHRFVSAGQMMHALSAGTGAVEASPERRRVPLLMWIGTVLVLAGLGWAGYLWRGGRSARLATVNAGPDYLRGQQLMLRPDRVENVDAAVAAFEKAIRTDARNALAYAGLGQAYLSRYRRTRDSKFLQLATENCNRAAELNPELSEAHWLNGQLLAAAGNTGAGLQEVQSAIRLDPRSPDAWGSLGNVYDTMGRRKDGEEAIRKAIELNPNDWRWRNQLGAHFAGAGEQQAAAEEFREVIRLTPDNAQALSNLGGIYIKLDRLSEARQVLEQAIRVAPRYAAYVNLGTVLLFQGQFSQAVPMFEKALALNSSNYLAWGNLGSAREWSGDAKGAAAAYETAVRLAQGQTRDNPNDPGVLADLGSYLADLGRREESVRALRQALALDGENRDLLARTGIAFEILRNRAEAIRLIGRALDKGYSVQYLNRSPELAKLRQDPEFQSRLSQGRTTSR